MKKRRLDANKPEERRGPGGPDMEVGVEPMWLLVHILTTAYVNPNSSSLLPEISTPLFLIYVKEITPLSTEPFIQHSRNTRSHTETVFLSGTLHTTGEKNHNIELFFFIPVLYVVECPTLQMPKSAVTRQRSKASECFAQCLVHTVSTLSLFLLLSSHHNYQELDPSYPFHPDHCSWIKLSWSSLSPSSSYNGSLSLMR